MILEVASLSKSFGKKEALSGVSFSIARGEVVGLIGPNGSGKTTLLNILMRMIKPTAGSFSIPQGTKVGMSVSRKGFFDDMTVINNIKLSARLQGAEERRALQLMDEFFLDFGQMRFGNLSAGMKQKVSLLISFVNDNDLIFLDEPSNHLDIDTILKLRSVILGLKASGTTFLLTSHILTDLEKVCDRILFLKNGKLVRGASLQELMQSYGSLEEAYLGVLQNKQV